MSIASRLARFPHRPHVFSALQHWEDFVGFGRERVGSVAGGQKNLTFSAWLKQVLAACVARRALEGKGSAPALPQTGFWLQPFLLPGGVQRDSPPAPLHKGPFPTRWVFFPGEWDQDGLSTCLIARGGGGGERMGCWSKGHLGAFAGLVQGAGLLCSSGTQKKKKLCEALAFHGTPHPLAKASPWVGFGRGVGERSPPGDAGGDGLRVAEQAEGRWGLPATSGVLGSAAESRGGARQPLALGLRYRG